MEPVGGGVDECGRCGLGLVWADLSQGPVGPGGVVVREVLALCLAEVAFVDGEGPVE